MAKIRPRSTLTDCRNEAHRYAVTVSEHSPCAVLSRHSENFTNIHFGEFRSASPFPDCSLKAGSSPWVAVTFKDAIRMFSRPVVVTATQIRNFFFGARAASYSAIPNGVPHILARGGPIEIFRGVIGFYVIAMGAMKRWVGSWAIKRSADQIVCGSANWAITRGKVVSRIASVVARRKYPAEILALPVRNATTHSPDARNLIIGCIRDYSPLFGLRDMRKAIGSHTKLSFRVGQGRAALERCYRPAFITESPFVRNSLTGLPA